MKTQVTRSLRHSTMENILEMRRVWIKKHGQKLFHPTSSTPVVSTNENIEPEDNDSEDMPLNIEWRRRVFP